MAAPKESNSVSQDDKVSFKVFGEAGCINTNEFVLKTLAPLAADEELMSGVSYDFVAFGNAYYPTEKCGPKQNKKPEAIVARRLGESNVEDPDVEAEYKQEESMCWRDMCLKAADPPADCFLNSNGMPKKGIYQHGKKEGDADSSTTA